jgi:hypothetical protein
LPSEASQPPYSGSRSSGCSLLLRYSQRHGATETDSQFSVDGSTDAIFRKFPNLEGLFSRCAIAAALLLPFAAANAVFSSHLHWPARQNNVDQHDDHYSREANPEGESRCHLSTSPQYVVRQLIERPGNLTWNWQSSLTQLSGESQSVADFQQSRIKVLMQMVRTVDDHRAHFVLMQLPDSMRHPLLERTSNSAAGRAPW